MRAPRHAAPRLAPAADPPGLPAPPEGGGALGGGVGGEHGALRPSRPARSATTTSCASPRTCSARRSGGVPLVPGRAVLIPCLHDEPFAHLGVVRDAFQACRGFIFNSPPEAALAEKLYGIGDRPAGVVGLGFDPPPPADPAAFRRRHGLEGPLLVYLGRKETGKNVPLLIQYALRYRAVRRADLTLVLAGDGPVTAPPDTPGVRDLGYLDAAAQGGGLRGRRGGLPAVGQRVLLDRPDGGLARGDAGPRPRALPGHDSPRLPVPGAASPSTTSTSSRRRWTSCSRTATPTHRLGQPGPRLRRGRVQLARGDRAPPRDPGAPRCLTRSPSSRPGTVRDIAGGAEAECRATARALRDRGVPVEILTTCARDHASPWADHHPDGVTEEDGFVVRRFKVRPRDPERYGAAPVAPRPRRDADVVRGRGLRPRIGQLERPLRATSAPSATGTGTRSSPTASAPPGRARWSRPSARS